MPSVDYCQKCGCTVTFAIYGRGISLIFKVAENPRYLEATKAVAPAADNSQSGNGRGKEYFMASLINDAENLPAATGGGFNGGSGGASSEASAARRTAVGMVQSGGPNIRSILQPSQQSYSPYSESYVSLDQRSLQLSAQKQVEKRQLLEAVASSSEPRVEAAGNTKVQMSLDDLIALEANNTLGRAVLQVGMSNVCRRTTSNRDDCGFHQGGRQCSKACISARREH